MRVFQLLLGLVCVLALAACGSSAPADSPADTVSAGALRISNIWMRTPIAEGTPDAIYMVIRNTGSEPDQLIGASSDAVASIELHQSASSGGVMTMRPVQAIDLPAGGAVAIESGAYHLMLFGRKQPLKAGDTLALHLTFRQAGRVTVQAAVRDSAPAGPDIQPQDGGHQH